jgi:2'-5' RNA ligase
MARRIRTFIAVHLDRSVRDRTVALLQELRLCAEEVKWVEEANLHITLLFLGEVDERELHNVCRAVNEAAAEHAPFVMSVETVGAFPNLRRPRTLWVGVGEGTEELSALHEALEPPLLALGCYRREDRTYTPHLTLGRVRGEQVDDRLTAALTKHAAWQGGDTEVREVCVMSSELGRDGPTYTVMSRAKLSGTQ